jgi:hypothetical protein
MANMIDVLIEEAESYVKGFKFRPLVKISEECTVRAGDSNVPTELRLNPYLNQKKPLIELKKWSNDELECATLFNFFTIVSHLELEIQSYKRSVKGPPSHLDAVTEMELRSEQAFRVGMFYGRLKMYQEILTNPAYSYSELVVKTIYGKKQSETVNKQRWNPRWKLLKKAVSFAETLWTEGGEKQHNTMADYLLTLSEYKNLTKGPLLKALVPIAAKFGKVRGMSK